LYKTWRSAYKTAPKTTTPYQKKRKTPGKIKKIPKTHVKNLTVKLKPTHYKLNAQKKSPAD
jgi:hypothetical protein